MTDEAAERVAAIRVRLEAATPGPWETRVMYTEAQVRDDKAWKGYPGLELGKCAACREGSELVKAFSEGHKRLHLHRTPWPEDFHSIYDLNGGSIAGNYDYDSGGIVSEADADFIAAAPADVAWLLERLEEAEDATDDYRKSLKNAEGRIAELEAARIMCQCCFGQGWASCPLSACECCS